MHKYLLFLTVFLALGLRLYRSGELPPSPNWDEVSLGYNAYSLLLTGRDEWGAALPSIFRAYGDYKLPGYIYATVPFVKLFGLTEFSTRLSSVISGTLLVLTIYLLTIKLLNNRKTALLTGFLMALSPWPLFLSRIAVEANFAIFLFTLGITLLLYRRVSLGILFIGLSAWTYNSFRIFAPLYLLTYAFTAKPILKTPQYSLFLILFIPVFVQLLSPSGQARYKWLTLLDEGAIARINQLQQQPGGRLIYNKASYLLFTFTINYFNHFNPQFLFIKGGSHYQFNVPNHGLLYAVTAPFFYIGLGLILFKIKYPNFNFLALWLILAPVAGSITRDSPHTLRAITLLPVIISITAFGAVAVSKKIPHLLLLFTISVLISSEYYLTTVLPKYRVEYSQSWQYGHRQVIEFAKKNYSNYDEIIITKRYGEPHGFLAFYWLWDPTDFQKSKTWDFHADWYWVNSLGKIQFVVDREIGDYVKSLSPGKKYLIISDPLFPTLGSPLFTINFLDDQPAFIIKEL